MNVISCSMRRGALLVLAGLASGAAAGMATAAPARQVPLQPIACTWSKLPPQSTQGAYFAATAFDTLGNKMYTYGGVDQSGDIVNVLGMLDVSDADLEMTTYQPVQPSGSRLERYGSAGAFRPKGDDSAVYWIGGADANGDATSEVQVFTLKTNSWRKVTPTGGTKRVFHAAAYDPMHDAIVIHGGSKQCKVVNRAVDDPPCQGDSLRTQFLVFDPTTGDVSWENGPQGGPSQVLGLTMVYDAPRKRMVAYGGTSDGNLSSDRAWSLDLSKDLDQAEWRPLNVLGTQPQGRFFHSATYHAARDLMVIYGGVTQMPFTARENALGDTWALRFSGTTATWTNLDTSVLDRVGSGMEYAPNHQSAILHGGRAQFRTAGGGGQTVNRDYQALPCGLAPTPTPTTRPAPTATPGGPLVPKVCDYIRSRVPPGVINDAVANAAFTRGFGEPCNPNLPPDPASNPPKRYLGLLNPGVPWDALFNPLVYNCGCR